MRTHPRRHLRTVVLTGAVLALAACGGSSETTTIDSAPAAPTNPVDSVAESTTSAVPPTDPPATEAPPAAPDDPTATDPSATDPSASSSTAPATTVPPTSATTVAPATTALPIEQPSTVASDLVLLSDGIGPLTFGTSATDVVDGLAGVLGAPTSDDTNTYPDSDGGYFVDADDTAFEFQFGRSVCFSNELCTHFGGDSADSLGFVGWTQGAASGALATSNGIGAGSRWADHSGSMDVSEGGCYSIGGGVAAGVHLVVQSSGILFGEFTEDAYVSNLPDPADVTVLSLNAGTEPFYLFGDC